MNKLPELTLTGQKHTAEITITDDGEYLVTCKGAQVSWQNGPNYCVQDWSGTYVTLRDAWEYAGSAHLDR
jgi:hypothetical protein